MLRARKSSSKDRVVEPFRRRVPSLNSFLFFLHPHSEEEHDEDERDAGVSNVLAP